MLGKILVIDDDIDSAELIRFQLEQAGYGVFISTDGTDGLRQTYAWQPDLILLDVMLPAMSGWSVCERLRQITDVPIVFVTILDQEKHIVRGLGLGADDFIVKPYDHFELMARIEAILRRHEMQEEKKPNAYSYGDLYIDFDRRIATRGDVTIALTPMEFRLLACLAEKPDKTLSHSYLIRCVWGIDKQSRNSLKLYIWYLRKKLEREPAHPEIILTDHGVGYRLNSPAT
jgi:DNA-binding response OmpR family regulator